MPGGGAESALCPALSLVASQTDSTTSLRAYLAETTPEPFAQRNIFCGNRLFQNKYEMSTWMEMEEARAKGITDPVERFRYARQKETAIHGGQRVKGRARHVLSSAKTGGTRSKIGEQKWEQICSAPIIQVRQAWTKYALSKLPARFSSVFNFLYPQPYHQPVDPMLNVLMWRTTLRVKPRQHHIPLIQAAREIKPHGPTTCTSTPKQ